MIDVTEILRENTIDEIGNGQVSDIKEWAIDKLVALFCAYNNQIEFKNE